ncbi:V-type proton ATPase subunit G [Monosporozyma servazzii]
MSSSQSNGIATLLKAEKEAQEIVSEARKYRQDKLKQAKKDASTEIAQYKAQKDAELKQNSKQNEGGLDALEAEAETSIQQQLNDIDQVTKDKKQQVADLLIKAVMNPVGGMHVNAA